MKNYKISENLYFIPRIRKLSSTFNWINSKKFDQLLIDLKKSFDYVIIDSPPFLSVPDTSLLINKSDLNFLLIRHELTKLNEVRQSVNNMNQLGKSFDGIIYNAYKKPNSYYGYYQYYGDYLYQYYADKYLMDSYEYKDE